MSTKSSSLEHAALILMDYQVGICTGTLAGPTTISAQVEERKILERVESCLHVAREARFPIIHVGLAFDESYELRTNLTERFSRFEDNGLMQLGSEEAEFVPESTPVNGEPVIKKTCVDPFIGTPLMQVLLARGVNRLFLAGVATNFVVESAVRHAADSGFVVNVLEDLCASQSAQMHEFAVENTLPAFANVYSATRLIEALRGEP